MVSELERLELQTTNPSSPVEKVSVAQEATDTGASSAILVSHSTIPVKSKDSVVSGTLIIMYVPYVIQSCAILSIWYEVNMSVYLHAG